MDIRLLGPVQVWVDGGPVDIGGRRPRAVLAALAVDANRPVPFDAIIDRVWDDAPPAQARHTVHGYVSRLRRVLEAGGVRLAYRHGGYALHTATDGVDVARVRLLAERARGLDVDVDTRATLLRQALGLWRGEPLAGLPGDWAATVRQQWTTRLVDMAVQWARVELGRDGVDVVTEVVGPLVGEFPLSEPLAEVWMRALAALGRGGEAVAYYAGLRRRLVDELGCDPGPTLRHLHVEILRGATPGIGAAASDIQAASGGAPGDGGASAIVAGPPSGRPVPAQLPADVRGFAGRAATLRRLDTMLAPPVDEPNAVLILAVSGTAGVGKTALAVHWAHRVADRFPDGQLFINLRGFDPDGHALDPADALGVLLDALGVSSERIPADLDARIGLYRSLLAARRVLVVLDNARDAEQVRPLLPGTPPAAAVVTSRNRLTPLIAAVGAHPIDIDVLSLPESRQLLAHRLRIAALVADPDAVDQIITACARLPLALAVAAARAQQVGLAAVAGGLAAAGQRLDELDAGDAASRVRTVFARSYDTLSPAAAHLFRLLGLHPGADIAVASAASLAGEPTPETRRLLRELTTASLITEDGHGRYTFHDLLRAFAHEMAHRFDDEHDRGAAQTRLLDHYVHTACAATQILDPNRAPSRLPLATPATGTELPGLTGFDEAMTWLTTERPVLYSVQRLAAATGFDTHAWQLAWALDTFLNRRGHLDERHRTWQIALSAADRIGAADAQAHAHRHLGHTLTMLGRHADARQHFQQAMVRYASVQDETGQAFTHRNLAHLAFRAGDPALALTHARLALTLFENTGHLRGQALSLNAIGWYHVLLGEPDQAIEYCERSLRLNEQLDDRVGQADALDSLGDAHHHAHRPEQAAECFARAITLLRALGDHISEAESLTRLGDARHAAGDPDAARDAWTQALTILTTVGHAHATAVHTRLTDLDAGQAVPGTRNVVSG